MLWALYRWVGGRKEGSLNEMGGWVGGTYRFSFERWEETCRRRDS